MVRKKKVVAVVAVAGVVALIAFARLGLQGFGPHEPAQNDMAVNEAARHEVLEGVIAQLTSAYVFPDKAAVVAKSLRARMQHGEFDSIASAQAFADTLTDLLQEQTNDKHLVVRYFEKAISEGTDGHESPEVEAAEQLQQLRVNYGFAAVSRLQFNIGYIDLHAFDRPQQTTERIAAAMTLLGDTYALIIDLRKCGGGDPETVMLFASYLFDKRTHLNDIYFRDENRTEERWTTDSVAGRKYGETRKIYLLTSSDTFSGCEDFAYALKNAGRATLVGETSGGGAHAGSPHRVSAHFMMFVPSGLPINPVTHTDWEGTGVTPDMKTSAKNALDAAQVAILQGFLPVEMDAHRKELMQARIDELE